MSEGTSQPADQPQRARAPQGTRRTSNQSTGRTRSKRVQPATPASSPAQETAAPLAALDTTSSAAPQALPAAAAPAQPAPNEPPIGECWGEFPPPERQAELKQRMEVWELEQDHGNRPGPFAGDTRYTGFKLTGADVYWLSVLVAGAGEVAVGRKKLADHVELSDLHLEGAYLFGAQLEGAYLFGAQLEGSNLSEARLEGANLYRAKLKAVNLSRAHLSGADLREATLDGDTQLAGTRFEPILRVAGVAWNGTPLIRVDWRQVSRLGDEAAARQETTIDRETRMKRPKSPAEWLDDYQAAARAYRQLAVALR